MPSAIASPLMLSRNPPAPDPGERPDPLWTTRFALAMLVQFGASIVFVTLMTYMAVYAMTKFHVQDSAAGFAASSFILGSAISRIFVGKYLDFVGRRRLIIIALIVFTLCSALYPLSWSFMTLIATRMLHGAAFGAISTGITSAAVTLIPATRRGEGMGLFLSASTIAMGIGPVLAVSLSDAVGANGVFLMTALSGAVSLVATIVVRLPEREPTADEHSRRFRLRPSDVFEIRALPISFALLLCAFGYSCVITFLAPYTIAQGMPTAASAYFIAFAAAMFVVRLFTGRRQDLKGDNAVVIPLMLLFAVALATLVLATQPWILILAGVLGGMSYGGLLPSLQVVAVTRASPERLSIALTTHYLMLDSGVALGPVIFGFIIAIGGYPGLYAALSATVVLATGVYWFVHGRHHRRRRN